MMTGRTDMNKRDGEYVISDVGFRGECPGGCGTELGGGRSNWADNALADVFCSRSCADENDPARQDARLHDAIDALDASEDEREGLHEILDREGFGGREDDAHTTEDAALIAEERLVWYRDEIEEGFRPAPEI
jgi:hypothetical protein